MSSFLSIHEDSAMAYGHLAQKLAELRDVERGAWMHFKGKFQKVLCLIGALGNMQ